MQDKHKELCLLILPSHTPGLLLDILCEFLNGVLEGRTGIVDFIDNQDVLSNKVASFYGGEVEPLGAGDLGSEGLFGGVWVGEFFVEGEADGLDGDVGWSGGFEEGAEDTGGDETSTSDAVWRERKKLIFVPVGWTRIPIERVKRTQSSNSA